MNTTTAVRPPGNPGHSVAGSRLVELARFGGNNPEWPLTIAKWVDRLIGNDSLEGGS
jgi:hypothetical protein